MSGDVIRYILYGIFTLNLFHLNISSTVSRQVFNSLEWFELILRANSHRRMLGFVIWFDLIGAVRSSSCLILGWWCVSSVLPPSVRGRMFSSHFPWPPWDTQIRVCFSLSHRSSVTRFWGKYEMCVWKAMFCSSCSSLHGTKMTELWMVRISFSWYLLVYSAAPGLCCSTRDLRSSSFILIPPACEIWFLTRSWLNLGPTIGSTES